METIDYNLKPKTGSVYSYGWDQMKKYFLPLFLVIVIVGVASIPTGIFRDFDGHNLMPGIIFYQIFVFGFSLFILYPLNFGGDYLNLKAIRNQEFQIQEIFDAFKTNYLNVVLASLLSGAIILMGIIMLLIPGIIFACRLALVPYLVMDKKLDPVKAVEESWRLTKGYGWRIFGMGLLAIPIAIAGLIVLGFGVIVSAMWINAAFAAMYQAILMEKGEYVADSAIITENGNSEEPTNEVIE